MKKEIKTNYAKYKTYSLCSGENKNGWVLKNKMFKESIEDFFERLVESGYTNIKFYETSTRIRGCHDVIAYVKR